MVIIARQRNVRRASEIPVEKFAFEIENLEPVISKKEPAGDLAEGQNFVDERVIHSRRRFDLKLELSLFSAMELDDTVDLNPRRTMEPVGHDVLPKTRFDPHDR